MRHGIIITALGLLTLLLSSPLAFGDSLLPQGIGRFEVSEQDFVFAKIDDVELSAHIYKPKTDQPVFAAVEVHGGAWNYYDRMAGQLYNKALASAGLMIMAVDFRQGPKFKHPLASRDVAAAVRYLRVHAKRLNINMGKVGLIGSSSGGHLALLAGVRPNAALHQGTPIVMPDGNMDLVPTVDGKVDYVVALWPVSDPLYRYEYAKKSGRDKLAAAHDGYFASPSDMQDASIADIIKRGEAEQFPAILIVQPGKDENIPMEMTFELMKTYQTAGGYVDYAYYPNQPHAFAHKPTADTDDCIRVMRNFIQRRLETGEK